MALINIIQDAASQLGLRQPSVVVGSTDRTARTLLRFANQEGKSLAKYHDWQALIVSASHTSLATSVQTGALGTDYDRLIRNPEFWNTSLNQKYLGPTPSTTWLRLQQGITGGVTGWWRIMRGDLYIYPAPTAGQTISFEYITKNWCESSGGTGQSEFMADTDVALLDEELITLGVIWRYRHSRGFAQYAEDMVNYEREKELAAGRDRGTGRITPTSSNDGPIDPIFNGTIDGNA